jgi:oligopeptidase A
MSASNPLLLGHGLPPFDRLQIADIEPAMTQLLAELDQELTELEAQVTPSWEGLVEPLSRWEDRLTWSWGIVGHLMGVKNSPELRQAYEQIQPQVIALVNRLGQSQIFYQGFKTLRASDLWPQLAPAQQRIIASSIREAELSGVGLQGAQKERFNAIQLELGELSTQFSNNLLDATQAFQLKLTQPEDIAGLPQSLLSLAAQTARNSGETSATPEKGPWIITLDYPSYLPFMKHSQNRQLRETLYRAFVSRASAGKWDNAPLIERILALRLEEAQLLGYKTYAELSLTRKMAPQVEAVETLLEELRQASYPAAQQELAQLQTFSQLEDFQHWDVPYWSERQRESLFDLNAEALRPYFPLPQVLEGLFSLAQRLFGITITAADGQAPVWHDDVRFFAVEDENQDTIAHFYLDPYSRPAEKRGGAWMDDCINRGWVQRGKEKILRLPVAYLVCNQTPPLGEKPSLMTFEEVTTLFHEFGHGIHHMLTRVNYSGAAGIHNVEWDAVELPSQFMENWCYDRATLFGLARHYQTGAPLPEEEYQKLLAARNYLSGSGMLRQIHLSLLDLELHHRYQPGGPETIAQLRDRLAQKTLILPPLPEDAFLCSFGHIFAGGYAAGYYSYKWAEVLSADAFAAFEEGGLADEAQVKTLGRRFRETVLALGGSEHPLEIFKRFRGREPQTKALLKHNGLLVA